MQDRKVVKMVHDDLSSPMSSLHAASHVLFAKIAICALSLRTALTSQGAMRID